MSKLTPTQRAALKQAAQSSLACEKLTQLPAELTLAQWILESGWGAHQPGNNCFGIKAYEGCSGVQRLTTIEVIHGVRVPVKRDFATFPSLEACFAKHAGLLVSGAPYAVAWQQYLKTRDVHALIAGIAPVYSTDPHYADLLFSLLAQPDVAACLAGPGPICSTLETEKQ